MENRLNYMRLVRSQLAEGMQMKRGIVIVLIVIVQATLWIGTAAGQQAAPITYSGSQQPPLMDRQGEIGLALSACRRR